MSPLAQQMWNTATAMNRCAADQIAHDQRLVELNDGYRCPDLQWDELSDADRKRSDDALLEDLDHGLIDLIEEAWDMTLPAKPESRQLALATLGLKFREHVRQHRQKTLDALADRHL